MVAILSRPQCVNSLGLSDAIWRLRSWSTLVQVMACCLMAPGHYLNQCWLIISEVLRHSSEDTIIRRFEDTNQLSRIEDDIFKITFRSPRGQWVKGAPGIPRGHILSLTFLSTPEHACRLRLVRLVQYVAMYFSCRLVTNDDRRLRYFRFTAFCMSITRVGKVTCNNDTNK